MKKPLISIHPKFHFDTDGIISKGEWEGQPALAGPYLVVRNDQEAFVELAIEEIERLHEGNIARYRIRPSEYRAWRDAHRLN